jgi:hypothetical protein
MREISLKDTLSGEAGVTLLVKDTQHCLRVATSCFDAVDILVMAHRYLTTKTLFAHEQRKVAHHVKRTDNAKTVATVWCDANVTISINHTSPKMAGTQHRFGRVAILESNLAEARH